MRYSIRNILRFAYILLSNIHLVVAYFGLTSEETIVTLSPAINLIQGKYWNNRNRIPSAKLCAMMDLNRKQRRMCRKMKGVGEALREAIKLSATECKYQFQYERWNCLLGHYRQSLLLHGHGFKEASFLHSVSSAGLVHALSRACSRGNLDRCTCDESKGIRNKDTWKWGGCGDNIPFGLKFGRKFLRGGRNSGEDIRAKVDHHNSRLGIRVVKRDVKTTCKCHGVSGSCSNKICWRQLAPFHEVGTQLKEKYEKAVRVSRNQATGTLHLVRKLKDWIAHNMSQSNIPRRDDMLFIDKSPNFCSAGNYSPGTSGRVCIKDKNCDTLCCGRGYNVQSEKVMRRCQCQVIWCCHVTCKKCEGIEESILCK